MIIGQVSMNSIYDVLDQSLSKKKKKNNNKKNGINRDNDNYKCHYYIWSFSVHSQRLYMYSLVNKPVRMFWPEDNQYYLGRLNTQEIDERGRVCVVYDIDESFEYVDVVKLLSDKVLEFI